MKIFASLIIFSLFASPSYAEFSFNCDGVVSSSVSYWRAENDRLKQELEDKKWREESTHVCTVKVKQMYYVVYNNLKLMKTNTVFKGYGNSEAVAKSLALEACNNNFSIVANDNICDHPKVPDNYTIKCDGPR